MSAGLGRELAHLYGLARSRLIYDARPLRDRRQREFYRRFVRPGDLCFDIGAHVGSRTRVFLALDARVVAVEPQPRLARRLARRFAGEPRVDVVEAAVAAAPGAVELAISPVNPTVGTGSRSFLDAVASVPSFRGIAWSERCRVPALTLDRLIERHGRPSFVKIDVEGMEDEALAGLSQPVPALSFEFLPAHLAPVRRCLDRLGTLASYRYNVALGERPQLLFERWLSRADLETWLAGRHPNGTSGDVYARRDP